MIPQCTFCRGTGLDVSGFEECPVCNGTGRSQLKYTENTSPLREQQSFWESNLETAINIATGFIVSYLVWVFIVPVFWPQLKSPHSVAIGITVLFTVSSYLRSLFWRRFFEKDVHKFISKLVRRYI